MPNCADSFDELLFFAKIKKRPGMFLGEKSLLCLRNQLFGMQYAFSACGRPDALKLFMDFVECYHQQLFLTDANGYVCWWNHLLYTSGNHADGALDLFFDKFEAHLLSRHQLKLPEVD